MLRACEPEAGVFARRPGQFGWVERIHQALGEGRFRLWSQEIRGLADGAAAGRWAEVLLRLHEDGRIIPPEIFVPAAEADGVMPALDRWVVGTAVEWLAANPRTVDHLAINLSGQSLADERFEGHVLGVLERAGVAPGRVCFEITETATIADLEQAARTVGALRRRGCRFALDDFGSGLSSFTYLTRLPFDLLKIDGSLVREMTRETTDRVLVEAILHIGRRLGMETVAESVEDEATLEALRAMGVEYAQGYAVAPPRPLPGT
jgi:EAL domain-containing protein (putative c-di-GMP-specific phosphodiesterase class I)